MIYEKMTYLFLNVLFLNRFIRRALYLHCFDFNILTIINWKHKSPVCLVCCCSGIELEVDRLEAEEEDIAEEPLEPLVIKEEVLEEEVEEVEGVPEVSGPLGEEEEEEEEHMDEEDYTTREDGNTS